MPNRRTFLTSIGSAAIIRTAQALEVSEDDAILDILKRRIEVQKRAVGMAVCVVTPNQRRFVAWGRERLTSSRPITPDTVFEIGSITKVFTALLLADMTRRGDVQLDDPVARHLPTDFHLPVVEGRQITLADLATHTSGLPRWPPSIERLSHPGSFSAFNEANERFSVQDLKAWLAEFHPHDPAGSVWGYSNVGYALLGLALAHRGGESFETLLQERVIDRAGLRDTAFHATSAMRPRLAESHDSAMGPLPPLNQGIFIAGGGLLSTPRDLSRFAAAVLPGSSSPIAPDEQLLFTVRRRARPWFNGVQALGWEMLDAPGGAFVSKDGVTTGQAASIVLDPEKRVAVVVFSNTFPIIRFATASGGGVGAADLARHLLRPQIPLGGQGGTYY